MAGTRYKLPNGDDTDVKINNDNYIDSSYTAPEAKSSVKTDTNNQTTTMATATSTVTSPDLITSPVSTDGAGGVKISDDEQKAIKEGQINTENEQLNYIVTNNPEYLEGSDIDLSNFYLTGNTDEMLDNFIVVDENGVVYSEPSPLPEIQPANTNLSAPQIFATGQLQTISVSNEFAWPTNPKGHITSEFTPRVLNDGGLWEFHPGMDIGGGWNDNSKVSAVCIYGDKNNPSIVVDCYPGGTHLNGFGNYVKIQFTYKNKKFIAFYGHLKEIYVIKGKQVYKGNIIGMVGGTGGTDKNGKPIKYAVHLHFEIQDINSNNIWNKWVTRTNKRNKDSKYYGGGSIGRTGIFTKNDQGGLLLNGNDFLAKASRFQNYIDPNDFFNSPDKYLRPTLTLQS